jgi:uncharacterized membrane protein
MISIPLTTNPFGWLLLGVGGYALYRAGKRKGEEEAAAAKITAVPPSTDPLTEDQTTPGEK